MNNFKLLTGIITKRIEVGNYYLFLERRPNSRLYVYMSALHRNYLNDSFEVRMNGTLEEYCKYAENVIRYYTLFEPSYDDLMGFLKERMEKFSDS